MEHRTSDLEESKIERKESEGEHVEYEVRLEEVVNERTAGLSELAIKHGTLLERANDAIFTMSGEDSSMVKWTGTTAARKDR